MNLSIRNRIPGTVTSVTPGEVMAVVKVRLDGGQDLTAVVTAEAVDELDLAPGAGVYALLKSTQVALATTAIEGVSIRNQIPGTVDAVTAGGAMALVKVTVVGGTVTAAVTKDAVAELGLLPGSSVVALVKSTEISLATA